MKRYNTPLLGSNYGATIRLLGPHAPKPVLHPLEELEPIRNPFLPPDAHGPQPPLGATLRLGPAVHDAGSEEARLQRERESDVWSNDTPSRLLPKVPASGRMVFGSFLIFAVLGMGGFAALYSVVHSDDAEIRVQNAEEESHGTVATNAAPAILAVPAPPASPATTPPEAAESPKNVTSSLRAEPAERVPAEIAAVAAPPSAPPRVVAAPAPPPPAKFDSAPAPKIVVHVEPAPVVPSYLSAHRETREKDGPASEDAVLGSAHPAEPAPSTTASTGTAAQAADPSAAPAAVPPGNDENPDAPKK